MCVRLRFRYIAHIHVHMYIHVYCTCTCTCVNEMCIHVHVLCSISGFKLFQISIHVYVHMHIALAYCVCICISLCEKGMCDLCEQCVLYGCWMKPRVYTTSAAFPRRFLLARAIIIHQEMSLLATCAHLLSLRPILCQK